MNSRPRRLPRALFWITGVLVAGVILSVFLFVHLRSRGHRDTAEAAADLAHQQIERLRVSILRSMEVLHSVDALHAAHGHLDRQHFRAFVQSALARKPELQALCWNPAVPHPQRATLEAAARADGLEGFTFRESLPNGEFQPAQDRPEYAPIYHIEPFAPNQAALGFDLASDPSRTSHTSGLVLAIGLAFTLSTCAHLVHAGRRAREVSRANTALQEEVVIRQRAEAAAAAANKAKSDFLTSMSHELRTPLNAILGYTQLMRRDAHLSPEQRDATLGIQTSGQHLLGLINEVLDLAKIEAGRIELLTSDFDLGQLAASIATTFRPLCFQKRLTFRLELAPLPSHRVHGDEVKLRQILINLVGNAVKFTRVGEVQLHIRPLADPTQHWVFEVLDTGLGIPESEQQDIFKPFHQGSGRGHQGGTGLGLAIAQRQVQFLGGTLQFQSERGVGSRFYFALPLPPACLAFPSLVSELSRQEAADDPAEYEPRAIPFPSSQPIVLPRDLAARLALAAELHSSTALKACLPELRQLGPETSRFADELRWLLRSYDMQGVQTALARVQIAPSAA